MSAECSSAKPALEANHIILLNGASDRHRRSQWPVHRCGTPDTGKGAVHLDNQRREQVGLDPMMPHVATNDADDLKGIDPRRRVLFCYRVLPDF